MAVIRSELLAKDATLSIDGDFRRQIVQKFLITTDSDDDGPVQVVNESLSVGPAQVPALWSAYGFFDTSNSGVYLMNKQVARIIQDEDDRQHWIITCTWNSPEGFSSSDPPQPNPLNDPVRYHLEWANYTRIVDRDANGDAITNSAGDEFDPPIERDDVRPVLVAIKNLWPLQAVIDVALEYKNAINNATFFGAPPHTAKIESITSGQLLERNNQPYYATTFRVQFIGIGTGTADTNATWDVRLVDRGRQHKKFKQGTTDIEKVLPVKLTHDGVGPPTVYESYIEDRTMFLEFVNLIAGPGPLSGFRLLPDTAPAQLTGTAFQIYPEKNFSGLGIGG